MEIVQKQPYEELIYTADFSDVMDATVTIASIDSVSIVNCGVVSGSSSASVGSNAYSGRAAQTKVTGGTHGESYLVTYRVIDSAGQKHEHEGIVEVIER